jgi:hypothetical protein
MITHEAMRPLPIVEKIDEFDVVNLSVSVFYRQKLSEELTKGGDGFSSPLTYHINKILMDYDGTFYNNNLNP